MGRQRKTTPRHIEAVALDLFSRQGFVATTVEQVATGAGISTRSFFRYFRSKDEVVLGSEAVDRELLLEAVRVAPPASVSVAGLVPALVAFTSRLEEDRERVLLRAAVVDGNPALRPQLLAVYRAWEESLAGALGAGAGDTAGFAAGAASFEAKVAAAGALALLSVSVREWCESRGEGSLADTVIRAADALLGPGPAG